MSRAETTRTQSEKKERKGQDKQTNKQTDTNESDPLRRVPAFGPEAEERECVCVC